MTVVVVVHDSPAFASGKAQVQQKPQQRLQRLSASEEKSGPLPLPAWLPAEWPARTSSSPNFLRTISKAGLVIERARSLSSAAIYRLAQRLAPGQTSLFRWSMLTLRSRKGAPAEDVKPARA
eukprot:CAMPEP_0197701436 /NCGR_PEP_ID=MMETSP1338-20131121/123197_1 /TAXON_ID=43686 ORGANISM="Pelagodinium beii, Strain RCC1491" /NCGR_SAMPLE_ID=MMETSP1338 /ASSEMBLY_ACC=CAM_ASM_000754 /LENGTH=121 /DNA_ID=CAMNT_0043285129 /DNA_START=45 /DNA_END=405 /DNA_ORIENTATION=+